MSNIVYRPSWVILNPYLTHSIISYNIKQLIPTFQALNFEATDAELLRTDLVNEGSPLFSAPAPTAVKYGRQFDFGWEREEDAVENLQFTTVNLVKG